MWPEASYSLSLHEALIGVVIMVCLFHARLRSLDVFRIEDLLLSSIVRVVDLSSRFAVHLATILAGLEVFHIGGDVVRLEVILILHDQDVVFCG